MQPIAVTITAPDVLARLGVVTRSKKPEDRQAMIEELAAVGLRTALGMRADLTPEQAAIRLGCSRQTILNYVNDLTLPNAYFITSRQIRIPASDLEALKKRTIRCW